MESQDIAEIVSRLRNPKSPLDVFDLANNYLKKTGHEWNRPPSQKQITGALLMQVLRLEIQVSALTESIKASEAAQQSNSSTSTSLSNIPESADSESKKPTLEPMPSLPAE